MTSSPSDDPMLDTRLTYIRRQSGLDSRAALFVLSPVSQAELAEFITRCAHHIAQVAKLIVLIALNQPSTCSLRASDRVLYGSFETGKTKEESSFSSCHLVHFANYQHQHCAPAQA